MLKPAIGMQRVRCGGAPRRTSVQANSWFGSPRRSAGHGHGHGHGARERERERAVVHLSWLLPRMGQDQDRRERGAASNGKEPLRLRIGCGHRLVPDQPASVHPRPACPFERDDAGPLAYYGTSGNYRRLSWYADEVASIWNLAYAPSLEAPGRCYHPFATTDTPTAVGFAICY